jgi:hypothetical protein
LPKRDPPPVSIVFNTKIPLVLLIDRRLVCPRPATTKYLNKGIELLFYLEPKAG